MHQPGTFYDVITNEEPQYHLDRANDTEFRLLRRFGYIDLQPPHHNFQVPKDLKTFHTDLTSTPAYFTWLVPSTGAHLPAALLHDGLVFDASKEDASYIGPEITRLEADRIFRDAMKALGTGPVRRWIIWSAVALATSWADLTPRLWWRALGLLTALEMLVLGTLATLDLLDVVEVFPWMGERPFLTEFIAGGVGAFVLPMLICIPWWRLYFAALIATILFAFLIHVTMVLAMLLALYEIVEWLAIRGERRFARFQTSPAPPETSRN